VTWFRYFSLVILGLGMIGAEPIHLKTRKLEPSRDRAAYLASPFTRRISGRSHYLVQFDGPIHARTLAALDARGMQVTGYVPHSTLMIAAPDDFSLDGLPVRWIGRLEQRDKISPLLPPQGSEFGVFVVEIHSDVDMAEARAMVREHGLRVIENPALAPHDLLVAGRFGNFSRLASWDEVAYVFPASAKLLARAHIYRCAGAVVQRTTVASYAGAAQAWPVSATGGLALQYVYSQLTGKLPVDETQSELLRALSEWTKYANVSFAAGTNAQAPLTVNILFASGAHGDPYPFDGPGGVLAHTFYPAPSNPEPIAGDMHLDNDENWQIGADIDVYSVALHEAGHALGMVHTDDPSDVMYPYYQRHTTLGAGDVAIVQSLYGAPAGSTTGQPPALPLVLSISSPAVTSTTTASTVSISGTASGGTGAAQISWSTIDGQTGAATGSADWSIAAVPVSVGDNIIAITATDAANHTATRWIQVTREQPPPPPQGDLTPPTLTLTYPNSSTLATRGSSITLQGTATDNVGVTAVVWTNLAGGSGVAIGTTAWRVNIVPLAPGSNVIIIKAMDAAGNTASVSTTVVRE